MFLKMAKTEVGLLIQKFPPINLTSEPKDFGLIKRVGLFTGRKLFCHSHGHNWVWPTVLSLKVAKPINTLRNSCRQRAIFFVSYGKAIFTFVHKHQDYFASLVNGGAQQSKIKTVAILKMNSTEHELSCLSITAQINDLWPNSWIMN